MAGLGAVRHSFQRLTTRVRALAGGRKARKVERGEISSPELLRDLIRIIRTKHLDAIPRGEAEEKPPLVTVPAVQGTVVEAYRVEADGMIFFVPVPNIGQGKDEFFERVLRKRWYPLDMIHALLPFTHGGVMLDVGANIGTTSIPRAHLELFERIHAFEPEARNFACLAHAIAENGLSKRIRPWPNAVGAEARKASLLVSTGIARYHVSTEVDKEKRAAKGASFQDIELISLDGWAEAEMADAERVRFVKVDTQGFEFDVLSGASSLLARKRAVWQLEMSARQTRSAGRSFGDLLKLVEQRFDWFIDLRQPGQPVSTKEIAGALQYVVDGEVRYTDIVAFHGPSPALR